MALTINTKIINDADNYTADAKQIRGGYVSVATLTERNNLPAATIMNGSLCYVSDESKFYKYNGTAWEEAEFGGGNVDDVKVDGTSVVTNKIANITLSTKQDVLTSENAGDNVTIEEGGGHDLPEGYTELEYISTDGTVQAAINTNIYLTQDCEITSKWILVSGITFLYGARIAFSNNAAGVHQTYAPFGASGKDAAGESYISMGTSSIAELKQNSTGIYMNNIMTHSYEGQTFTTSPVHCAIFNCAQSQDGRYFQNKSNNCRCYYFKIENTTTSTVLFNGIPAQRDSDSVLGIYDLVTNTFFTAATENAFTAGPEVETVTKINALSGLTATVTELNYCDGVTSNIQTQLNSKVSDVKVNGTSVVTDTVANVTVPTFVQTTLADYLEHEAEYKLTNNIYFVEGTTLTDVSEEER